MPTGKLVRLVPMTYNFEKHTTLVLSVCQWFKPGCIQIGDKAYRQKAKDFEKHTHLGVQLRWSSALWWFEPRPVNVSRKPTWTMVGPPLWLPTVTLNNTTLPQLYSDSKIKTIPVDVSRKAHSNDSESPTSYCFEWYYLSFGCMLSVATCSHHPCASQCSTFSWNEHHCVGILLQVLHNVGFAALFLSCSAQLFGECTVRYLHNVFSSMASNSRIPFPPQPHYNAGPYFLLCDPIHRGCLSDWR